VKRAATLLFLASCAGAPPPPVEPREEVVAPAALAVKRVLHEDDGDGFLKKDSPFAVVLTRAVDRTPGALALLDQSGASIGGTTAWVDRQLLVFYPAEDLPSGLEVVLRLAVPLRAKDGTTLPPGEIGRAAMRPIKLTRSGTGGTTLAPMGVLTLDFERDVPTAEVSAHGVLTVDGKPLAFTVSDDTHKTVIRAVGGFPPDREVRFGWKEGAVAMTTIGRVALEPVTQRAKKGFEVRVGESLDHCFASVQPHYRCDAAVVHVTFATPLSDEELDAHVHPSLKRATTGDLRGHRFEVALPRKKTVTVVLDGELADSFGQTLGKKRTLEIQHTD
jgi:hypothetical protein